MSAFTIVLSFLPGFAWLLFYLQEDAHPEPKRLIFLTFLAGAAAAIVAFYAQVFINGFHIDDGLAKFGFPNAAAIIVLLVFACIEELAKFGGAYFAIHKNRNFDEPTDAMIYMIVAALGFATVENLGVLYGLPGVGQILLGPALQTIAFRFVGATLLHTLASGIIGYYWAISIRDFNAKKILIFGILLGSVLHMSFNYLILTYGSFIYPLVFVIAVGLFILSDFEKLKREKV